MSRVIDSRVVEMQFDNKDFERNVQTSITTLGKLKQSLDLDSTANSLNSFSKTTRRFDLSGISNAFDSVTVNISAKGMLLLKTLNRIYDDILNAGKKFLKSLTIDPVSTGFSEYETQINAIQTIMSNTRDKMNASGITDESERLAIVNDRLDQLNAYADKTIYNFTEMTRNIGTFTAAGVELDTAVESIKGIANLAAVSGSTSQQASTAMYQLSQAISTGTVKLMDWNSVVNAGMGGELFQKALQRTAKAMGTDVDAIIAKAGSFRESLSKGWLTSDILTTTLEQFAWDVEAEAKALATAAGESQAEIKENMDSWIAKAMENKKASLISEGYTAEEADEIIQLAKDATEAATKVKTLSQLVETLKEAAQSGWTQTWEYVIGDYEEAKAFLTTVSDAIGGIINDSADARNAVFKNWHDLGGRDTLIQGLIAAFNALYTIVDAVSVGLAGCFKPLSSSTLIDITNKFTNLTTAFENWLKSSNEFANGWSIEQNLRDIVEGFGSIFSIAWDSIKAFVKGFEPLLGPIENVVKQVLGWLRSVGRGIINFREYLTKSGFYQGITNVVSSIVTALINAWNWISNAFTTLWETISSPFAKKNGEKTEPTWFTPIAEALMGLWEKITALWNKLTAFDFSKIGEWFSGLWDIITGIFTKKDESGAAGDTKSSFLDKVVGFFSSVLDWLSGLLDKVLALDYSKIGEWFTNLWANLQKTIDSITQSQFVKDATAWFSDAFGKLGTWLTKLWNKIKTFDYSKIVDWFNNFWTELTKPFRKQESQNGEEDSENWLTKTINFFKNLWNGIKEFGAKIAALDFQGAIQIVKDAWQKVVDWVTAGIANITAKSGDSEENSENWLTKTINFFKNLWNGIKEFGAKIAALDFQGAIQMVKDAWQSVVDWFTVDVTQTTEGASDAGEVTKKLDITKALGVGGLAVGFLAVAKKVKSLTTSSKTLVGAIGGFQSDTFSTRVNAFSKAFLAFGVMVGVIIYGIKKLGEMDPDRLERGVKAFQKIGGVLKGLLIGIGIAALLFRLSSMFKNIGKAAKTSANAFSTLSKTLSEKLKKINPKAFVDKSSKIEAVANLIKSIGLAVALIAASVWAFGTLYKNNPDVLISGLIITGAILIALGVVVKILAKMNVPDGIGDTLFKLAAAIALMIVPFFLFGVMDTNLFLSGLWKVVVVGVVLVALIATLTAVSHKYKNANLKQAGLALLALAAVLNLIIIPIMLFTIIPWKSMGKAGAAITALVLLTAFMGYVGHKFGKEYGKNLLKGIAAVAALGLILTGLAFVIPLFSLISWDTLLKAGAAIGGLTVLAALMSVIGLLPLSAMAKGAAAIVLLATAVAAAFFILGRAFGGTMTNLSSNLWQCASLFNGIQSLLVGVDFEKIKGIGGTISSIYTDCKGISPSDFQTDVIATKLFYLGASLLLFANMINGAEGAGVASAATAASTALTTIKDIGTTMKEIAGEDYNADALAIAIVKIGAAFAIYGACLNTAKTEMGGTGFELTDGEVQTAATGFNKMIQALSDNMPNSELISTIASYAEGGGNDLTDFALGITAIGDALKTYGTNISGIKIFDVLKANLVLDSLVGLKKTLEAKTFIESITGLWTKGESGESEMALFATNITGLGDALNSFIGSVCGTDTSYLNSTNIDTAMLILEKLAELQIKLNKETIFGEGAVWSANLGRWFLNLFDGVTDLGDLAADAKLVGDGLSQFIRALNGVGTDADGNEITDATASISSIPIEDIEKAMTVLERLAAIEMLFKSSDTGEIAGDFFNMIFGKNLTSTFSISNMKTIGSGLAEFFNALVPTLNATDEAGKKLIDADGIDMALTVLERLGSIQTGFSGNTTFWDLLSGTENVESFGSKLPTLGTNIAGFMSETKDVDPERFKSLIDSIATLAQAQVQDLTGTDSLGLSTISTLLGEIGTSFATTAGNVELFTGQLDKINKLDKGTISIAGLVFQQLADAQERLSKIEKDDTVYSLNDMVSVLEAISSATWGTYTWEIAYTNFYELAMGLNAITEAVERAKGLTEADFTNLISLMEVFTGKDIGALSSVTGSIVADNFFADFGTSFQNGIDAVSGKVTTLFDTITTTADTAVDGHYNSFYASGEYLVTGFVQGIKKNTYLGFNAGHGLGSQTLLGLNLALDENSPSKEAATSGKYVTEGFVKGILSDVKDADAAGTTLGNTTMSALNNVFNTDFLGADNFLNGIQSKGTKVVGAVSDIFTRATQDGKFDIKGAVLEYGQNEVYKWLDNPNTPQEFKDLYTTITGSMATEAEDTIENLNTELGNTNDALDAANDATKKGTSRRHTKVISSVDISKAQSIFTAINAIGDKVTMLGDAVSSMQIVMDSGVMVGQIEHKVDQRLGQIAALKGRGL